MTVATITALPQTKLPFIGVVSTRPVSGNFTGSLRGRARVRAAMNTTCTMNVIAIWCKNATSGSCHNKNP